MSLIKLKEGDLVGYFTYVGEADRIALPCGQKPRRILCKCQCGNIISALLLHAIRKRIKTCGTCTKSKLDNGERLSSLYNTWRAMRNRCSPRYFQKQYYFEKGISVYKEWNLYSNFKKWALKVGYKDGLQIDRIDNNLGYYPENCRFVTQIENLSNREITKKVVYNGELIPFMTLCHLKNINEVQAASVWRRIKRGWTVETAINTPIKKGNYGKANKG